jgi:hypothetical protein
MRLLEEIRVIWEILVTEPLEKRRYREAHKEIPWCFLIYHGFHGEEEECVMWDNMMKKIVVHDVDFAWAPHNVPPRETYFTWFSQHVLKITEKRGRKPYAIIDADSFDVNGRCNCDVEKVNKLKTWAREQGISFISMTRDELYAGAWPQELATTT